MLGYEATAGSAAARSRIFTQMGIAGGGARRGDGSGRWPLGGWGDRVPGALPQAGMGRAVGAGRLQAPAACGQLGSRKGGLAKRFSCPSQRVLKFTPLVSVLVSVSRNQFSRLICGSTSSASACPDAPSTTGSNRNAGPAGMASRGDYPIPSCRSRWFTFSKASRCRMARSSRSNASSNSAASRGPT